MNLALTIFGGIYKVVGENLHLNSFGSVLFENFSPLTKTSSPPFTDPISGVISVIIGYS
jgi:hypothetical protein